MSSTPTSDPPQLSATAAFGRGVAGALASVLLYVLFGSYAGIGALAHDLGFGLAWATASTVLIWAAPAQVILVTALGSGAGLAETALAVGASSARLLPMVVALMPMIRGPRVRFWQLILPAHFTAISVWIEALRLLPGVERERRIAFCNGLSAGFMISALSGTAAGFYLAAELPGLFAAGLLFLTPVSFLMSATRSARHPADRLALIFGLLIGPALAIAKVDLDLLWTGIVGGTLAHLVHRIGRVLR